MRRVLILLALTLTLACHDPAAPAATERDLSFTGLGSSLGGGFGGVSRVDLGTLGGRSSYATDLNNSRTVVGWSETADGGRRAFRWTPLGGMTDLGTLPGHDWSQALNINDDGRIFGVSGPGGTTTGTPVVWSASGRVRALDIPLLPGASFGTPTHFNRRGDVVGWDMIALQHAWIWSASGGKHDITADASDGAFEGAASQVNSAGFVVGTNHTFLCRRNPQCWHAYLWSPDAGYRDLGTPGGDPNTAVTGLGMNDEKTIVGWLNSPDMGQRPYLWTADAGFTVLPTDLYGYAMSVNRGGTAVGASLNTTDHAIQATLWPRNGGMIELSPDDPNPAVAVAINDLGAVAGWSAKDCCSGENHAMLWLPGLAPRALLAKMPRVTPPTGVTAASVVAGTAQCLTDTQALLSRGALFACVAKGEEVQ